PIYRSELLRIGLLLSAAGEGRGVGSAVGGGECVAARSRESCSSYAAHRYTAAVAFSFSCLTCPSRSLICACALASAASALPASFVVIAFNVESPQVGQCAACAAFVSKESI